MNELLIYLEVNKCTENDYIRALAILLKNTNCGFCLGVGHSASRCSTKRHLDRKFRKLGLRSEWGGMKSETYSEAITARRKIRIEKKKLQVNQMVMEALTKKG